MLRIRISRGIKFHLKLTVLTFWTKFDQKGYFPCKTEKVNITVVFCIFVLAWVPNFSLNRHSSFCGPNIPQKSISSLKRKSYHRRWILHVQISLRVKFHLKLIIWFFGPNLPKKGIPGRKRKKWTTLNSACSNWTSYQILT